MVEYLLPFSSFPFHCTYLGKVNVVTLMVAHRGDEGHILAEIPNLVKIEDIKLRHMYSISLEMTDSPIMPGPHFYPHLIEVVVPVLLSPCQGHMRTFLQPPSGKLIVMPSSPTEYEMSPLMAAA